MKRRLIYAVAAVAAVFAGSTAIGGTITGSKHDFSALGWSGGEICIACHAPHNNLSTSGLLWNHTATSATYTLYSSSSLDATVGQPGATSISKLCLSCHDGTVAPDSFGGATGSATIAASANFGTNLANDHPIGFTYDAALVTLDPGLKATTTTVTIGSGGSTKTGTIAALLLTGNQMECSSCHDVHNTFTAGTTGLLKISNAASALCLTCHTK